MTEEKILESSNKNCKNCGGNLVFYPEKIALECEQCKSIFKIEGDPNIKKHNLDENKSNDQSKEYFEYVQNNKVFKCANCGSNVVLNVYEISKNCPYCGTSLVVDDRVLPGLLPDAILPFAIGKNNAAELFAEKVKKKWLVPKKFKNAPPTSQISGLYLPAFAFDGKTSSSYNGELYNEYTETDSEGKQHTRREYFHVSGSHNQDFENVLIESSNKISQSHITALLPYNFNRKMAYRDEFVRGFVTEHYAEGLGQCKADYRRIAEQSIRSRILAKHPHDGVSYLNVNTVFDDEKYSYYLVPMYKFEYEYKNKKFVTYMNGQTGKLDYSLPKSTAKITLIVLLALLVILIPIIIGIILGIQG